MEILKVKDWVKVRGQQFIITKKIHTHIMACTRISDSKEFIVSKPIIEKGVFMDMFIKDKWYTIQVYIGKLHEDLVHVTLCGNTKNLEGESFVRQEIQINDIEKSFETIVMSVRLKLISFLTIQKA